VPGDGLGPALRAWRDRLDPAEFGLPANTPRRAPGLRREELAILAGVSIDYVVRLEQGRASAPSVQVLSALALALQLSDVEQSHLFTLAGQPPPGRGVVNRLIPGSVRRLLAQLHGNPLAVYDAGWGLLAWSPLWAALTGDPSASGGRERNVVWQHFTRPAGRVTHADDAAYEASMVADLRHAAARYHDDSEISGMVDDLLDRSARFRELWSSRTVAVHEQDHKTVRHPDLGPLQLDCDTLTTDRGDLRVVIFTAAPGSETASKLELLSVIGTEQIGSR
jgi:transcriptional regulator with XRE-family HTH domain